MEVGHTLRGKRILEHRIVELAKQKYESSGYGITFKDIRDRFSINKAKAQRSLKHFHSRGVLFTANDLITQGIYLMKNKSPQEYFATCNKYIIIENLRKRNVHLDPTELNLSALSFSKSPSLDNMQQNKADHFLDVLICLPFRPPYVHKLQLQLCVDKNYFSDIAQLEAEKNRGKPHYERMGRADIGFRLYPNGRLMVDIACSYKPFRIYTNEDELILFSFLGQVRDRLMQYLNDPRERAVPPLTLWVLKQCDVNKDVRITDKCQVTFPDIQLRYAGRVFRLYVTAIEDQTYCRAEESLKLDRLLPDALESIRHPFKSLENKIDELSRKLSLNIEKVRVL